MDSCAVEVADATPTTDTAPKRKSIFELAAEMPEPTPEEIAEAEATLQALEQQYDAQHVERGLRDMERERLREELKPHLFDLSVEIKEPIPVIEYRDVCIASEGNISAIVGEAKSKKTFLCSMMIAEVLRKEQERLERGYSGSLLTVLWVDTEQSVLHVKRVVQRIHRLADLPDNRNNYMLSVLTLREIEPRERADALYKAIEVYRPKLVVIDGISDLMYNTNDIEESDRTVGRLMALSTEYNCHILSILHTNPNSDKARGHIGSTLCRKVETMLYVHKVGEMSYVEPQYCRNMPFERFAFKVEEFDNEVLIGPACEGLGVPVECEVEEYESVKKEDDCVRILRDNFGGACERSLLCNKLVEVLGVTHGNARVKVSRAISRGLLVDCDKYISLAAVL